MSQNPGAHNGAVTLVIPAANDHIRFARLVMSTIATKAGFDYDTIDDLRIAVDELCASTIALATPGAELTVVYRADEEGVRVEGSAPAIAPGPEASLPSELSRLILKAVVDDHGFHHTDGMASFSLFRRLVGSD